MGFYKLSIYSYFLASNLASSLEDFGNGASQSSLVDFGLVLQNFLASHIERVCSDFIRERFVKLAGWGNITVIITTISCAAVAVIVRNAIIIGLKLLFRSVAITDFEINSLYLFTVIIIVGVIDAFFSFGNRLNIILLNIDGHSFLLGILNDQIIHSDEIVNLSGG